MNSPLKILREEPKVAYMKAVDASPTREQIRERINLFTAIPSAARSILIEVCSLVELGGKGRCWAGNKELANRACCAEMTVSKHLQSLFKSGLLSKTYLNNDHSKRDLIPSPDLIAAYRTEGGLSGVLNGVKWGTERGLSRVRKGVKRGTYQIENTKEDKEEYSNCSYVVELEKQVADLREELNAANAACQVRVAEVLALSTANAALEKRLVEKSKRPVKVMAPIAERFAQDAAQQGEEGQARWARFCKWESEFPLPNVYAMRDPLRPAELTKLVDEFGGGEVKDMLLEMENYADIDKKKSAYLTAHTWLKRGRKRQEDEDARREAATARYRLANPAR